MPLSNITTAEVVSFALATRCIQYCHLFTCLHTAQVTGFADSTCLTYASVIIHGGIAVSMCIVAGVYEKASQEMHVQYVTCWNRVAVFVLLVVPNTRFRSQPHKQDLSCGSCLEL